MQTRSRAFVFSRIESSSEPIGAALWPVRCGATRMPSAAAKRMIAATSSAFRGSTIAAGR
jgi:hypothetical protein